MDQNTKKSDDAPGARAPVKTSLKRLNIIYLQRDSAHPHENQFPEVGSHRRVSEGAGAPRFCTWAFPMGERADWRGDYSSGDTAGEITAEYGESKIPRLKIMLG